MLQIKSISPKTVYDVVIEVDNEDGKEPTNVSVTVEKLSSGEYSPISYEDNYAISGTYGSVECFSKAMRDCFN